jgi:hypothetical protein
VRALVLLSLALAACATAARKERDPFGTAMRAGDRLWGARPTAGMDAASKAYEAMLVRWKEDGRVLARLAEIAWSRAMVNPDDAATWHAAGREYAMRCVIGSPQAAEVLFRVGDRVVPELLATVDAAHAGCLVWAAAHTSALVADRGPGAALDLADVGPLLHRAVELAPEVEPALRAWTEGRAASLDPRGDPTTARARMREAIALAPGIAWYRATYAATFPDVTDAWEGYVPDPVWAAENAVLAPPPA